VALNPYKYRRILTPQQVKDLYSDEDTGRRKRSEEGGGGDDDALMEYSSHSHEVWEQEPDNVYEIINLLREIGFKTNQSASVWPYTEFMQQSGDENEDKQIEGEGDDDSMNEGKELVVMESGSGLNPQPDTFNDFYLLFARFPEILSMEIGDIRRKLHVLDSFQIDDIRILMLKDPRILRRPSHHIRWLLEVFDDYFIDDFSQIIELCPHFLASTSKKEMLRRLVFIHSEILEPWKEYNVHSLDANAWYRNMQIEVKHLEKDSKFIIKNGKTIQKTEQIEKEMINGVYLDDLDKEAISEFISKHPDFIGNSNVNRMTEMKRLLRRLGIKNKRLADLIYEYPQILNVSPKALHECVDQIKRSGIRNYRQYIMDNIHDVLTYASPADQIVIHPLDEEPQQIQSSM